jgi:hypothetical protein
MVGSTGTVQNDGLKNKEWWFKERLLKDTSLKQVENTLASANEKRRHYY